MRTDLNNKRVQILHFEGDYLHRVTGRVISVSEDFLELETDRGIRHWIPFAAVQKIKEIHEDDKE